MSDRGNDLTGGSDGEAFAGAGVFADIPIDDIDALEPASDIDDVAFGLDVNPDDVDLTFDPGWQPSVANRSWGDPSAGSGGGRAAGSWVQPAGSWGDPAADDEASAPSWRPDRGWGD